MFPQYGFTNFYIFSLNDFSIPTAAFLTGRLECRALCEEVQPSLSLGNVRSGSGSSRAPDPEPIYIPVC